MKSRTFKNALLWLFKISDKRRWGNIENHSEDWSERTQIMSRFIKPGETVFEFGAGRCHLKDMLPAGSTYTPSDIVARTENTFVCDLNQRPLPAFPRHDVAVCSGVLEYVYDLPEVVRGMAASFDRLIVSYADVDRNPKKRARLRNGWFNHFNRRKFLEPFLAAGYQLQQEAEWNKHGIYVLEKARR